MRYLKISSVIVLLCQLSLLMVHPARSQSEAASGSSTESTKKPLLLTGGVEHSERLEPVAQALLPGSVFSNQSIPRVDPNNDWYWIPGWYAGQKHSDYERILQDVDFRSGQQITPNNLVTNRQDLFIGFQPDKNGQIWEYKRAPYTATVEADTNFQTMFVRVRDPVQVTADRVVIRLVQTSVVVDKSTRRILRTEQQEQFNTYVPVEQGVVNVRTSIKSFGADGAPLVQEESAKVVVDRGPFTPVDTYQGRDMRVLFRDFMLSRGYGSLLPPALLNLPETPNVGDNAPPNQVSPTAAP